MSISAVKTAIVTGSARGIGKAIALRLAKDGYNITVNDIPANEEGLNEVVLQIKSMGRKAIPAIADVSKQSEVLSMIQTSVNKLGPLTTMIANAGIAQVKPLLEVTELDMQRMFSINVFGVHNCFSLAAKQMIAQGAPPSLGSSPTGAANPSVYKLISASSVAAFKPFSLLSHYVSSKWAVRGLTQSYAMELAEHKITANAYCPGIVGTAMWDLIDEKLAEIKGTKRGSMIEKHVKDSTALGRTSVPEDVVGLVSFLASGDSDFVTGQSMCVDGGIVYT